MHNWAAMLHTIFNSLRCVLRIIFYLYVCKSVEVFAGDGRFDLTQTCATNLAETHPNFTTTKFRTGVCQQYDGYCSEIAFLGFAESQLKRRLSVDWYVLKILKDGFETALNSAVNRPATNEPESNIKWFISGARFTNRGHPLFNSVGVVDHQDFTLAASFLDALSEPLESMQLSLNGRSNRLPPLFVLTSALGNLIYQIERLHRSGASRDDIAESALSVKRWADDMIALGLSGLRSNYDPIENLKAATRDRSIREINWINNKIISLEDSGPGGLSPDDGSSNENQVRRLITEAIDRDQNVIVLYFDDKTFFDPRDGTATLPNDFNRPRWLVRNEGRSRHVALIEGYSLKADGRIDRLLIKNSQGAEAFAHGYQQMSLSYLMELGILVLAPEHYSPRPIK